MTTESFTPLKQQVVTQLRNEILAGERAPGSRIKERDIAEDLDISRVPVREALNQLEADGLIEYFPRRGAVVRSLTLKDVEQLFEIRSMIEPGVYALAAERATDEDVARLKDLMARAAQYRAKNDATGVRDCSIEFHREILHLTKNDAMVSMFEPIFSKIEWLLAGHEHFEEIDGDHANIVDAIAAHNVELAAHFAVQHANGNKARITEIYLEHSICETNKNT